MEFNNRAILLRKKKTEYVEKAFFFTFVELLINSNEGSFKKGLTMAAFQKKRATSLLIYVITWKM